MRNRKVFLPALLIAVGMLACGSAQAQGTNLALNKPATASSSYSASFSPPLAVDGSSVNSSRWASVYTSQTNPAGEWLQVDLGASFQITQVKVRWADTLACAISDDIQVAPDGANLLLAASWSSIYSNTSGACIAVDGGAISNPAATGRYVRVLLKKSASQFGFSISEFEIYGSSAAPPPPPPAPGVLSIANITMSCNGAVTPTAPAINYPLSCTATITLSDGTVMAPLKFSISLLP